MSKDMVTEAVVHAGSLLLDSAPLSSALKMAARYGPRMLKGAYGRRAERRFARWLTDVATDLRWNPEQLAETILASVDAPWAHDVLVEGFRHLMDALDESVVPSVAALSAEYLEAKKPPDRWFRRVGNLLVEMDGEDVTGLATLLAFTNQGRQDPAEYPEAYILLSGDDLNAMFGQRRNVGYHSNRFPGDQRLFSLISKAGLGSAGGNGDGAEGVGPTWLTILTADAQRLARYVVGGPRSRCSRSVPGATGTE